MPKPEPAKKTTPPPRVVKTERQRAEELLDAAQKRVTRFTGLRDRLKAELEDVENELAAATRRRDYVAADPALTTEPSTEAAS